MSRSTIDLTTKVAYQALDVLFLKHPVRTSIGVIFGLSLAMLSALFSPALHRLSYLDVSKVKDWQWIAPGILLAHLPTAYSLFFSKPLINESISDACLLIERGNFSTLEKKAKFRELFSKVIEQAALSVSAEKQVKALKSRTSKKAGGPAA